MGWRWILRDSSFCNLVCRSGDCREGEHCHESVLWYCNFKEYHSLAPWQYPGFESWMTWNSYWYETNNDKNQDKEINVGTTSFSSFTLFSVFDTYKEWKQSEGSKGKGVWIDFCEALPQRVWALVMFVKVAGLGRHPLGKSESGNSSWGCWEIKS